MDLSDIEIVKAKFKTILIVLIATMCSIFFFRIFFNIFPQLVMPFLLFFYIIILVLFYNILSIIMLLVFDIEIKNPLMCLLGDYLLDKAFNLLDAIYYYFLWGKNTYLC